MIAKHLSKNSRPARRVSSFGDLSRRRYLPRYRPCHPFSRRCRGDCIAGREKGGTRNCNRSLCMKFFYADDPTPGLVELLGKLETRLFLRPANSAPLVDRIHRVAEASLALKELDYLGSTAAGRVRDRIEALTESILLQVEERYEIAKPQSTTPLRAKVLRQEIIKRQKKNAKSLPIVIRLRLNSLNLNQIWMTFFW